MAVILAASALLSCSDDSGRLPVAPSVPPPPPKARLKTLTGEVSVKRAADDGWTAAEEDLDLRENDKVRTAKGAGVSVEFASGAVVMLGEDALIAIAETRPRPGTDRTDLTVIRGRINAEVAGPAKQSLSVSTPAATVRAGREIVFQ